MVIVPIGWLFFAVLVYKINDHIQIDKYYFFKTIVIYVVNIYTY